MAEYLIQDTTLVGIADAIRAKTGGTEAIYVSDMANEIEGIVSGGDGEFEGVLRYFQCHIDPVEKTITLYNIRYDLLYADTGNYDVTIPDTICGFQVVISA